MDNRLERSIYVKISEFSCNTMIEENSPNPQAGENTEQTEQKKSPNSTDSIDPAPENASQNILDIQADQILLNSANQGPDQVPENVEEKKLSIAEKNLEKWKKYTDRIIKSFQEATSDTLQEAAVNLFKSYLPWTWAVFARECFATSCGAFENCQVAAAILAIINSKLPDVGAKTISYVLYRFRNGLLFSDPRNTRNVENSALFLGECYRQRMISSNLMILVFTSLFEKKRQYIQNIIRLFWNTIPILYEDDQDAMTLLFAKLYEFANDKQFANQIMNLSNWRQQNWSSSMKGILRHYTRIPRRFDVIEEEDQNTHYELGLDENEDYDENGQLVDITANFVRPHLLEEAENMRIEYKNFLNELLVEDEEEEDENDIKETQPGVSIDLSGMKSTAESVQGAALQNEEMQVRRTVYLTIVSSARAQEAAHKLIKMQNKYNDKYNRPIVQTAIDYVGMEKTFNRNLALVLTLLCGTKQDNKRLTEEYFKTNYEQTYSYNITRITNIACLYSSLLASDSISWKVMQVIRLTEEDTNSPQRVFIRILFEELAKNMSHDGIIRKLRDPDVVGWTSGVFLTDTLDHAEFSSEYFSAIGLDFICEGLHHEIALMHEAIARQKEEELRETPQMAWMAPSKNLNPTITIDLDPADSFTPKMNRPQQEKERNIKPNRKNKDDSRKRERRRKHKHRHRHHHMNSDVDDDDV
ncbi:hypothetical protein TRFO_36202 [Tritrichomonas foetus]|uniref:MI domain-containing protein n=1 Tax=Tritrichomonas foetus TaxID=1144522 RepID=A0A1J4JFX3_9EUKA|nr:hypothetical protein TRFO_36202 [Tritrichomonas foetus]|eukprot:OHS97553.1 hypothetical protein TRFO_36202 [Tritrichomonas foetus]